MKQTGNSFEASAEKNHRKADHQKHALSLLCSPDSIGT